MRRDLFGDPSHYYSEPHVQEREPGGHSDTPVENRVRQLLTSTHSDAKHRVEQACKQSNLAIREYLRSEMALKLSQADRRQAVPYQVVDGIPVSLAIKIEKLPDPVLLLLMEKRQVLKTGEAALAFALSQYPAITRLFKQEKDAQDALTSSRDFFHIVLQKLDSFKLPDVIRDIDEDVLGAYFFKVPMIQIYWMPIGLIAGTLDVSLDDLSFVVLAHELAHAYTHVGLDIDGVQWETSEFARTSKMIVEGLAQFYTESICNKYANRQPDILKAFEKLLAKQPEPYTHFREWKKQQASEVVRFCMIAARCNNIRQYNDFLFAMKDIEQRISVANDRQLALLER